MDGKTVSRMRLLERSNVALTAENTELSARTLEMADRLDQAVKASYVDRLLVGALVRHYGVENRLQVPIEVVNQLREELGTPPGLSVHTSKDEARGAWMVELKANPAPELCPLCSGTGWCMRETPEKSHPQRCPNGCEEPPKERPSLIVLP